MAKSVRERSLAIAAFVSGIFVLTTWIAFGYLESVFIAPRGTTAELPESPLLPDGWQTYRGDVWSVGYPDDYIVTEHASDQLVRFAPDDGDKNKTYFLVQKESQSVNEIKIQRATEGYLDPVDVTIANYPGVKYTTGNHHVEFFLTHGTGVYLLASDDPENTDVGEMFATFAFTE